MKESSKEYPAGLDVVCPGLTPYKGFLSCNDTVPDLQPQASQFWERS